MGGYGSQYPSIGPVTSFNLNDPSKVLNGGETEEDFFKL